MYNKDNVIGVTFTTPDPNNQENWEYLVEKFGIDTVFLKSLNKKHPDGTNYPIQIVIDELNKGTWKVVEQEHKIFN